MIAKTQAFSRCWNIMERRQDRGKKQFLRGHDMTKFSLERSYIANRDIISWRTDEKSVLNLQPNGAKRVLTGLGLLEQKGKTFAREGKRLNRKLQPSHHHQYLLLLSGKEIVLQCLLKPEFGNGSWMILCKPVSLGWCRWYPSVQPLGWPCPSNYGLQPNITIYIPPMV